MSKPGKFFNCSDMQGITEAMEEIQGRRPASQAQSGADEPEAALKATPPKPPMTVKAVTARLVILGLWVVVIKAGEKRPMGNGWGLTRKDIDELNRLLSQNVGAGLGVCLGPGRGPGGKWLIDIEGDGPGAEESLLVLLSGEHPATIGWTSTRGKHYLFIVDGERLLELLAAAGAKEGAGISSGVFKLPDLPGLEFRIGGFKEGAIPKQLQSVIPPTPGTDGKPREWNGVDAIATLPDVAYDVLEALAERKAIQSVDEPQNGNGHAPTFTNRAPGTGASVEERARKYAQTIDPAISGQGGHNRAFYAACKLGPGFDLPRDLAIRIIGEEFNHRCQPPWSQRELEHKVDEAYKVESRRGWLLNTPMPGAKSNPANTPINGDGHHDTLDLETVEIIDRWPKPSQDIFHGVAGEIVAKADPHTEADPVATLVQFLVALGNMLGRRAHFRVGATRHYLNLFVGLVGATAVGRKGTSWDVARWLLSQFDAVWADDRIQGGLVSGEGLIYHVRDERYEEKEVTDKKTKVVSRVRELVDAGVSDKRLLIVETEMSRMLKAMNRDTNTLSDVLRQGWDTGNLRTMGKQFPAKATQAHISLICHVTQADIAKHLTETDSANGFANRFLWCCVRRSKVLPDGGDIFSEDWSPIKQTMRRVIDNPRWSSDFVFTRDAIGKKVWHEIYPTLSAGKPGLLGKILSRAEAQVMRLACLYAILDNSAEVTGQHLLSACALWEYCEASARLVFGDSLGDPNQEKLLAALKEQPDGLTRKQISIDVFGRHKSSKEIVNLLADLLTQGLVHRKTDASTGGRPAERWFYGKEGSKP